MKGVVVRRAKKEDSAFIMRNMLIAMDEFVHAILGTNSEEVVKTFLLSFVSEGNNQYSFENCFVAEQKSEVVGSINIYDGSRYTQLHHPIKKAIQDQFGNAPVIGRETMSGEYYIDSLGVEPEFQGKGIGTALLRHAIRVYGFEKREVLGLLVDSENRNAERLYLKMGFEFKQFRMLAGVKMKHLQKYPFIVKRDSVY